MDRPLRNRPLVVLSIGAMSALAALAVWALQSQKSEPNRDPDLPSVEPTVAQPARWNPRWDPEVGLWWQDHPGHTKAVADLHAVHPAPSAAARLLLAAQARQLASVDVSAVLKAIRQMQTLDNGDTHGSMRWYWEEKRPNDFNAAFFTGLSLIALERCYADQLNQSQHQALLEILTDLRAWFLHQAAEREFNYPNRFIGDVVCAWLIGEIIGVADDAQLRQIMLDASDSLKQGWGWGEHLSDIYSSVCLDELSALLLLSQRLPDDVRAKYKALFEDLLSIDDAYGGLPRVPALRTYAFGRGPTHASYRDTVRPLPADGRPLSARATPVMPPELGGVFQHFPPIGATLHERGWHEMAPPRKGRATDLTVPCHDGARAVARIEDDVRLGSVTRFPLIPTAEGRNWGLSWQCAPVALWRNEGDWSYLQWESQEQDRIRSHPAADIALAYLDNALAEHLKPPILGRTFSLQRGGDLIVLRVMPSVAPSWDRLTDRLRMVDLHVSPTVLPNDKGFAQMLLRYPQREISVQCIPISTGGRVHLRDRAGEAGTRAVDWGVDFERGALADVGAVAVVWGISINGRVDAAPAIKPIAAPAATPANNAGAPAPPQQPFELHWSWPRTQWRLRIDPLADDPLAELPPN